MDGKELDKDLTMLQQPDPDDAIFDELLKNPPKSSAVYSEQDPAQMQEYVTGLRDDFLVDSTASQGSVDLDLDQNRSMFESRDDARARNQGEGVKGLKAIGGGLLQGALVAAEQLGYVGDLQGVYQQFMGDPEGMSGNWWSDLMRESQEGLRESEAFKIYESEPDQNNLMGQIFKWTSLESAISSAVGFGLTGLGATRLVSALGSMGKFKDIAKFTDITMGRIKGGEALAAATEAGAGMTGATRAFVGPFASSATSNYFMGQMMGTDTYKMSMESLEPLIEKGELSRLDAQKRAAEEAQDVVGLNMALTATAYIKFGSIFKRSGRVKGLVENPTALNQMKQLIKAGSPTAFTENVYQEMIQMEQIFDTKEGLGLDGEYSKNYWDRMTQLALSDRALHAGALGIVGGPIQFAIIQRPFMGKQLKDQKELYQKQQASRAWHKELVNNYYDTFQKYDSLSKEALINGNPKDSQFIEDLHVLEELAKTVENGTLSVLKKDIQDIINSNETPAGYDSNYKEVGESFLNDINKAETYLTNYAGRENRVAVVENLMKHDRTLRAVLDLNKDRGELLETVSKQIKDQLGYDVIVNEKGGFDIVQDPSRFEGMKPAEQAKAEKLERTKKEELDNFLKYNKDYEDLKNITSSIRRYDKFRKELYDNHKYLTSDKGLKQYKEDQKNATKNHSQNIKDQLEETRQKEADEELVKEAGNYQKFDDVKNLKPDLTDQEIKELNDNWDKEVGDTRNKILPESFTSRDRNWDTRTFTPNELLRSYDGRYFRVQYQKGAKNAEVKGKVERFSRPILIQTDETGKAIKGKKPFELQEFDFIREESMLPATGAGNKVKAYFTSKSKWGTYLPVDAVLQPNNVKARIAQIERAARSEVAGLNVPASLLKKGDFKWLEKYNHQLLNLPFKEPYDVVYKVRKEGEYEVYVDVYKREPGKEDLLLTPINRHNNVNYQTLIDMIIENKGELTGKAVAHYSSRSNLVKKYDENNQKVYSDISELRNTNPEYLINGQIILAQAKKGSSVQAEQTIARAEDGTLYTDGYITVDGVPKEIPFDSEALKNGDTAALILSPQGEIMPIALSAKRLIDLPSNLEEGVSFADDVVKEWRDAISQWLSKEIEEAKEKDPILREKIENNQNISEDQKDAIFALRKNNIVYEKLNAQKKSDDNLTSVFNKTIYKYIRQNAIKFAVLGENEIGENIIETRTVRRKKLKVYRENYFNPGISVSEKTGDFSPSIDVRDPNNFTRYKRVILDDNPKEFYEILQERRRRASINVLGNPDISTGAEGAAMMKDFLDNEGLTTDVDLTTPFMGSSGTFTVDGVDFAERSAKKAISEESKLSREFKSAMSELEIVQDSQEHKDEIIENVTTKIEEDMSPNSDWIDGVSKSESLEEVQKNFEDFIISLNLKKQKPALQLLSEYMTKVPNDLEARYEELKESYAGYSQVENLAKGALAIDKIQSQIIDGELEVKSKNLKKSADDPSGKYTQPDGLTFQRGSGIYHDVYGEGVFRNTLKNGKYRIELANGTTKDVYPGSTYGTSTDRAEYARIIKKMARQDEDTSVYKSLAKRALRLESKLNKKAIENDIAENVGAVSVENIIEEILNPLDVSPKALEAVKGFGTTERTTQIAEKLNAIKELVETYREDQDSLPSPEDLEIMNKLVNEAIPYTDSELDGLIQLAQMKADENKTTENIIRVNDIRALKSLKALTDEYVAGSSSTFRTTNYFKQLGKFKEISHLYLGTQLRGQQMTLGDNLLNINQTAVRIIMKAVKAEADLKQNLFFVKAAPVKPASAIGSTKEGTTKSEPQTTKDAEKIDLGKPAKPEVEATPVNTNESLVEKLRDPKLKVPQTIIDLASTKASEKQVEDLLDTLEVLRAENIPFNEALEEFEAMFDLPFKRGSEVTSTQEEFDAEVAEVKKMLPKVPIEVVKDVTSMVNKYGIQALGAFDNGVQYVVNRAKKGTVYHEAFHAVADLYLTPEEKLAMAKEAGRESWSLGFEETLAEQFEKFVNNRPRTIGQKVIRFFQKIMDWFNGTRSYDITEKIFNKIVTKGYAKSESLSWRNKVSPTFNSLEEYKTKLSEENKVLLQSMLDSNKIEIVC